MLELEKRQKADRKSSPPSVLLSLTCSLPVYTNHEPLVVGQPLETQANILQMRNQGQERCGVPEVAREASRRVGSGVRCTVLSIILISLGYRILALAQ